MKIKYTLVKMMDKSGDKISENYRYVRIDRDNVIGCCTTMQRCIDEINKHDSESWTLSIELNKDKVSTQGVLVHTDYDGNDSVIKINHCPFCGTKIDSEVIKIIQKISEKKCKEVKKIECENLVTEVIELNNQMESQ